MLFVIVLAAFAALGGTAAAAPYRADVRDLGRASARLPVSVALTLTYRHAGELEELVRLQSDVKSPLYHRFLTNAQFDDYFAPAPIAYERAEAALMRAGFRITQTFPNRTLIDASAPAAVAERYFSTEIHRVEQRGAGLRYANARPVTIPPELRGIVSAVGGLNNLRRVKPLYRFADATARASAIARAQTLSLATSGRPAGRPARAARLHAGGTMRRALVRADAANAVTDPGFESGGYAAWTQCGDVDATISGAKPHSGKFSLLSGTLSGAEPDGDTGLCEAVTIPANGVLSFWVNQGSSEPANTYSWQWALLMDAGGNVVDSFYETVNNTGGWKKLSYDVGSLAGKTLYLYFGVHGDGYGAYHTYQYVDDIALTNGTATPAPTAKPTSSPTAKPTAKPTSVPTAKPTAVPTAKPTATPAASPTPGNGTPVSGPLSGPDGGYGPLATAKGYDLPVQHGFNGKGRAAGVIIWADYLSSDIARYEKEWGLTRRGTTYKVSVDGGGTFDSDMSDPGNASVEAELDIETIEGNAPGADIYVYEFPSSTDQDIEDAYNAAVSANVVDVVNSSFGGCELDDTTFATATNQIALQGAAKGITFAASAGDSGSTECEGDINPEGVSSPAGGPNFVSVGGTSLVVTSSGAWSSEAVWNSNGGAGGGGVSSFFALPSYQKGIAGVIAGGRNQPDIALSADPSFGTSFYFDGAWAGPLGGTSWSSPIFTAYLTEVAQERGARAGFVTPALYSDFTASGYTSYHDITSGNNFGYAAKTGYDQTSGIGSVRSGSGLAERLP